jgi:hypothetical protein
VRTAAAIGLLAVLAGTAGCGSQGADSTKVAGQDTPEAAGLVALGDAYRTLSAINQRPPKNFAEVEEAAAAAPGGLMGLDARNTVVFFGAELTDLAIEPGQTPSDKVLAYEKKTPEQGGYVLMLDRTVKKVTADEFRSLPKAGTEPATEASKK